MQVLDFLPKYPLFENDDINPYTQPFNNVIANKTEFANLKLPRFQESVKKGERYKHQKLVSRYLSLPTVYNKLLIFHEMGTGKTCSAIGMIEDIRYDPKSTFKRALIIVKGVPIAKNFINEFFFSCTDGRYIPENWDRLTDIQRVSRMRKEYKKFYTFSTFETFSRQIKSMSDASIIALYSNYIIVVDEIHNIREKEANQRRLDETDIFLNKNPLNIYKEFFRFFHLVKEVKILLMTGTPMRDDVQEFASIMNLLLPLDNQFVTGSSFNKKYFNGSTFKEEEKKEFTEKIKGYVSYLKNANSAVKKRFIGTSLGKLNFFIVSPDEMGDFQSLYYQEALNKDLTERNIYANARQAALFVFPDGTYAGAGFNQPRYILKTNQGKTYKLGSELRTALRPTKNQSLVDVVRKYSSKFAMVIDIITKSNPSKSIVYCEFVNGSGCILFSKILELFGYSMASGNEKTKSPRYALLINQTTTDASFQKLIKRFNASDNIDGEYISVIIGSRVISEGYTFKNIDMEFILTPHWNYSETEQVIARGWRLGSHNEKIERGGSVYVDIYQHVSIPQNGMSIDLTMYEVAENKDWIIKQVEYLVKISAFDCPLTFERNNVDGYDGQRDCDYKRCDYVCDGKISIPDDSTYNIYYPEVEAVYGVINTYKEPMTLDMIFQEMGFSNIDNISHAIRTMINNNTIFEDKFGMEKFLRLENDKIFFNEDVSVPINEPLMSYYFENVFIHNNDSFNHIISDMFEENVPDIISALFKQPENFSVIINVLPSVIHRLLLQSAIVALITKTSQGQETRDLILKMFRGFYGEIKGEYIIWLHQDDLGVVVLKDLEKPGGTWVVSNSVDGVENYKKKQLSILLKTPIGFYGQENPRLNEFCLRNVNEKNDGKDKRRLVVGRRCNDYSKPILVDILANRIKHEIPQTFLNDSTFEEMEANLDDIFLKYTSIERNNVTKPTSRSGILRYLYFNAQIRKKLCILIQEWLIANNLIEQNFDCGTSRKKRNL